jgi:predicted DNA-binding transcriptional regulator YafY
MKKSKDLHETLAFRLAGILLKLNTGEAFSKQSLVEEFKVSERTIFRDLNRLGSIVDLRPDGNYILAPHFRGKLQPKDLQAFAKLTGVSQLFPDHSPRFLMALLDTLSNSSYLIKSHHYEEPKPNDYQFQQLDQAIREQRICQLSYSDKQRTVEPYKLINNKGIWYLAATENQRLKAYSYSRISQLIIAEQSFQPKAEILQQIGDEDDIWFNPDKIEVQLEIAPEIAYYFQRRKLLPQQEILSELKSGTLIIRSKISHSQQILPQIRYWLPHVRIISPASLKLQMQRELQSYLNEIVLEAETEVEVKLEAEAIK